MKKWMMNLIFGMQINIEVFYKLILSFWLCLTRHVPSSQNKFAYLCSITRKAWNWLPADDHAQSTQNNKFTISVCNISRNIKVLYKLISTFCAPKFPTRWNYHFWWAWWSILKVLKVTSLQFFAISQKRS